MRARAPAGTTTATVLARAILVEGCKSVAAGLNPMDLRRGINLAVEAVVAELKGRATMISTTEEISQVCVCSLLCEFGLGLRRPGSLRPRGSRRCARPRGCIPGVCTCACICVAVACGRVWGHCRR
jgi:hypothetical protein